MGGHAAPKGSRPGAVVCVCGIVSDNSIFSTHNDWHVTYNVAFSGVVWLPLSYYQFLFSLASALSPPSPISPPPPPAPPSPYCSAASTASSRSASAGPPAASPPGPSPPLPSPPTSPPPPISHGARSPGCSGAAGRAGRTPI